jgi:hypothetical protein
MLGLAEREAAECRRCGGDLVETTDYDSNKYVPLPPMVCLRCVALSAAEAKTRKAKSPEAAGMIHRVKRVDRPKRRKP